MSYRIMGEYLGAEKEEIDSAETLEEAQYLVKEYRVAFGADWKIWFETSKTRNPYCQCRKNPRVVEKVGPGDSRTEYCQICGAPTQKGKKLCTLHVRETDYAKQLAAKIAQMEDADTLAEEGKAAVSADENLKELILMLRTYGSRTIDCLSRDLHKSKKATTHYVNMLEQRGIVSTETTPRGKIIVSLATG